MRTFSLAAADLLEQLVNSGVQLRVVEGELQVRGMGDAQQEQIRQHKEELIKLVLAGEHRWRKTEEWDFGPVEIPSVDGAGIDVWMVGTRPDKPGSFKFWFMETQDQVREVEKHH